MFGKKEEKVDPMEVNINTTGFSYLRKVDKTDKLLDRDAYRLLDVKKFLDASYQLDTNHPHTDFVVDSKRAGTHRDSTHDDALKYIYIAACHFAPEIVQKARELAAQDLKTEVNRLVDSNKELFSTACVNSLDDSLSEGEDT